MKTLVGRLTVAVTSVVTVALLGFSVLLYFVIRSNLQGSFDARLLQQAIALANMVEERPAPSAWELELSAFEHLDESDDAGFYELWMDDGSVLTRSASLKGAELPRDATAPLVLPNKLAGRHVRAVLPPRQDDAGPLVPSGRLVTVMVARDTRALDAQLAQLMWLLLVGGAVTLAAAATANWVATRRGLQPVQALGNRIDGIDDKQLSERLPMEALPLELVPVVAKLNALLGRLEESFTREKRFSADVSHELRTPLAGLRSILEVTATRERTVPEYGVALRDALAVVHQSVGLVETLMLLARLDAQTNGSRCEAGAAAPTPLRQMVEQQLSLHAAAARLRAVTVTNDVDSGVSIVTDSSRLMLVLANLLSNAFEHTADGGSVSVESHPDRGIWFEVRNTGKIPEAALRRVFERFFRADPSRTGTTEHHGLGLAVVQSVCQSLGASVSAQNRADGWVVFTVRR